MSLDLMIDLETTGTRGGCGILSIGVSSFDLVHNFYGKISNDSCIDYNLLSSASTMSWWNKQSPEARQEAFSGTDSIISVLGNLNDWMRHLPEDNKSIFVWGNGADFDLPILSEAYLRTGMKIPWALFNGRCYRTLKNLYKDVIPDQFQGVKHNALADARFQAAHARKILQKHFSVS